MKIFFALFILIFLAFSGYHLTFRKIRLPLSARNFYLTGTEFLFLGLLLGPQFFNLLDPATLGGLAPLTALLLGWVGLLFGFQFEISRLRRFPLENLAAAVVEGGITLGVILGAALLFTPMMAARGVVVPFAAVLCLAGAAACTAQTGLALLAPEYVDRRSKLVRLLSYMSTVDSLLALLVFALAFFLEEGAAFAWAGFKGPLLALLLGFGLVFLYSLMTVRRCDEGELKLMVIGMTVLTSGAATMLDFSPLIANTLLGFGLVNLSRDKERIFQVLMGVEKPVYLILLVFLGAGIRLGSAWIIAFGAGLCGLRLVGKAMGGAVSTRLVPRLRGYPLALGFGLMDSGGLPLAILFDFQQRFDFPTGDSVVGAGLVAVVLTNVLSPPLFGRLFRASAGGAEDE